MNHLLEQLDASQKKRIKSGLHIIVIIGIILSLYAIYWGFSNELFTSEEALEKFLYSVGPIAPFIFIFIQGAQTVIPFIPASLIVPIGLLIFGMSSGFFFSFIGIIGGSIINFGLARKFGRPLVEIIGNEKQLNKYTAWTDDSNRFDRLFAFGMFFPFTPSNFLCYLAGLSDISFRKYLVIISLSSTFTLLLFSFSVTGLLQFFS